MNENSEDDYDSETDDDIESLYTDSEYEIDPDNDLNDIEFVDISNSSSLISEDGNEVSNEDGNENVEGGNENVEGGNENVGNLDNNSNDELNQKLIEEYQRKILELEELENRINNS